MDAPVRTRPTPDNLWGRRVYTVMTMLALSVFAVALMRREHSEWESVYVPAAHKLLAGGDLYDDLRHGFTYPPFAAVAAVPFTLLPASVGRVVWICLNLGALVLLVWAAWRSAGGKCPARAGTPRREHVILALGLLLSFRFIWNGLAHLQTDVLIAALVMAGVWALSRARSGWAALLLGAAAAVKATPLLFTGYLLWRGRWVAALGLAATAIGLNLSADLIARPRQGTWLEAWHQSCVAPLNRDGRYLGLWATDPVFNQSLAGLGYRLLVRVRPERPGGPAIEDPLVSPRTLNLGVRGVQLALGLAVLVAIGRPRRLDGLDEGPAPGRIALEASAVLLMMLLLSPMSGKAHFGILVLPAFCVARLAAAERQPLQRAVVALALGLMIVSQQSLVGRTIADFALWYGAVMGIAVTLLAGCCAALPGRRMSSRAGEGESAPGPARLAA